MDTAAGPVTTPLTATDAHIDALLARARKSYRSLDGVIVVSPRLVADLADALAAATSPVPVVALPGAAGRFEHRGITHRIEVFPAGDGKNWLVNVSSMGGSALCLLPASAAAELAGVLVTPLPAAEGDRSR